jgi:glycerophosphoryl diester phosphodiesterase
MAASWGFATTDSTRWHRVHLQYPSVLRLPPGQRTNKLARPWYKTRVPDAPPTPIYAHRFGSDYGPESSRSALRQALAGGVDGIEADVVLTRDDHVLALHDPILSYSTDLTGWAHERDADEILDAHLADGTGEASDEHPMTLEEVLELIPPQMPFQVDVKAYADHVLARRTAERACDVAREHGSEGRVEIISFFSGACAAANDRGVSARLVAWSDYAPEALAEWAVDHGMVGVSFEGFILSERIVRTVHDAGLTISAGAVNIVDQARKLLDLEVDILVSDRPHELRSEIAEEV